MSEPTDCVHLRVVDKGHGPLYFCAAKGPQKGVDGDFRHMIEPCWACVQCKDYEETKCPTNTRT